MGGVRPYPSDPRSPHHRRAHLQVRLGSCGRGVPRVRPAGQHRRCLSWLQLFCCRTICERRTTVSSLKLSPFLIFTSLSSNYRLPHSSSTCTPMYFQRQHLGVPGNHVTSSQTLTREYSKRSRLTPE